MSDEIIEKEKEDSRLPIVHSVIPPAPPSPPQRPSLPCLHHQVTSDALLKPLRPYLSNSSREKSVRYKAKKNKALQLQMIQALEANDKQKMKDILKENIDLNCTFMYSKTALSYALELNLDIEVIRLFTHHGADPTTLAHAQNTSYRASPLHISIETGKKEIFHELLRWTKNVNIVDQKGLSPLFYAAFYNHVDIGQELIRRGAVIDSLDEEEWSPLHHAVEQGNQDMVKLLCESEADINLKNNIGMTPVFWAVIKGNIVILRYLISLGSDLDIADDDGITALHCACDSIYSDNSFIYPSPQEQMLDKSLAVIDCLLNAGCHLFPKSNSNTYPFDLALALIPHNCEYKLHLIWKLLRVGIKVDESHINFIVSRFHNGDHSVKVRNVDSILSLIQRFVSEQHSLKHQCKLLIRKSLSYTRDIQKALNQVPLPIILKNYVSDSERFY